MPIDMSEVGRNVPFENPMLLVERTELNKVGLVLIRARAAARPVTVEGLDKPVAIDGPSMFFTWWPEYGEPPHPGEWIELQSVRILTMEELVDPEGATMNHPKDKMPPPVNMDEMFPPPMHFPRTGGVILDRDWPTIGSNVGSGVAEA